MGRLGCVALALLAIPSLAGAGCSRRTVEDDASTPSAQAPAPARAQQNAPDPSALAPQSADDPSAQPVLQPEDLRPQAATREPQAPSDRSAQAPERAALRPQAAADDRPVDAPAATAAPVAAPLAPATPCGDKGQPACPLQDWMERHLQQPLDEGDLAALAQALARVPPLAPEPSWNEGPNGWSAIAQAGVAAAKRGDLEAAEQSCKTCHKAWRRKYKDNFRQRPI
jgi:hypothetical protein